MEKYNLRSIIFGTIKRLEKQGFKRPTFEDLLENKQKEEGVITYMLMRDGTTHPSNNEIFYFGPRCLFDAAEDLIKLGIPEYIFPDIVKEKRSIKKGMVCVSLENMLNNLLDALAKKYGQEKAEQLRKKFNIYKIEEYKHLEREIKNGMG